MFSKLDVYKEVCRSYCTSIDEHVVVRSDEWTALSFSQYMHSLERALYIAKTEGFSLSPDPVYIHLNDTLQDLCRRLLLILNHPAFI